MAKRIFGIVIALAIVVVMIFVVLGRGEFRSLVPNVWRSTVVEPSTNGDEASVEVVTEPTPASAPAPIESASDVSAVEAEQRDTTAAQ